MHKQDTATLNQHALAGRIQELQLKQWWIARQIGVAPLTVNRWLTGKVRRISRDNLTRLAQLLTCEEDSLVYSDETDVRATQVEQSQAARLLVSRDTQQLFVTTGQYSAYERLLKAVMHPNLPIIDLLDIYSSLTMAAAEQERFEQARQYATLRLEYSRRLSDFEGEFEAHLNLITIDGASGKLLKAIRGIEELLSSAESAGRIRGLGLLYINLRHAYYLYGDIGKAVRFFPVALEYCYERPQLKIRDGLYAQAVLEMLEFGQFALARRLNRISQRIDGATLSLEHRVALRLLDHVLDCLEGRELRQAEFEEVLNEFIELERREETAVFWPALILRQRGEYQAALEFLDRMEGENKLRVYDPPFVQAERARLARATGQAAEARAQADQAAELFRQMAMRRRAARDQLAEPFGLMAPTPALLSRMEKLTAAAEAELGPRLI